jgi:pimeloyl-ACP methyl ester carboxylesterase
VKTFALGSYRLSGLASRVLALLAYVACATGWPQAEPESSPAEAVPSLDGKRCLQLSAYCGGCSRIWEWRAPHGTYQVHYVERGEGDDHIVLIHGFSANTFSWRSCIEPLARAGFHVWALDLIGFGASDKPHDAPYCFDLFVEQIRAFLQTKGIERPHLVGHSMGGCVTLGVAMRVPHLLKTITIVDSIGYPQEMPWLFKISRGLGEWLAPLLSRSTIAHMLSQTIQAGQELDDETIDAYWLPLAAEGGKKAAIAVLAHFDNEAFEKMSLGFRGIQLPALVVWGQDDELVPVSNAYRFHRDLRRSHLRVFPRCGHSPQEECSEHFVTSLTSFARRYNQALEEAEEPMETHLEASL